MPRSLLALSLIFYCVHASAFFTAHADKPDPYARRHYTAADLPAAKRKVALAKKTAASKPKAPSDEEIMAEIEREDAGTEAGPPEHMVHQINSRKIEHIPIAQKPEPSVALKIESAAPRMESQTNLRKAGPSSDEQEGAARNSSFRPSDNAKDEFASPAILPAAKEYPRIVVCRFSFPGKQKRASIASRYLISDSDGFEACSRHGGEVTAGNEDDRTLMNVKNSQILKRAKKTARR